MSASHGFVQSNDFSFLYDRPIEKKQTNKNSLLFVLENEKQFTKFLYLVKLSCMENYFNDMKSIVTLFIPRNDDIHIDIEKVENVAAKNIVYYSLVEKKISPKTFQTNSNFEICTKLNGQSLNFDFFENKVTINNKFFLTGVANTNETFIIYTVNDLLIPSVMWW